MPHAAFHLTKQPTLETEQPEYRSLPEEITPLLQAFRKPEGIVASEGVAKIQVNEVVSAFANVYEKIRNAIEYHEDHLLRKNATERIVKRRLFFKGTEDPRRMALPLISELIRGGYLPNDAIPETKIAEVTQLVEKHLKLQEHARGLRHGQEAHDLQNWLVTIMATEIEQCLAPAHRSEALVTFAYHTIKKDIIWKDLDVPERERDLQIYLAVHRALIRSDQAMIRTHLFHLYAPHWARGSEADLANMANRLLTLRQAIEGQVTHPLGELFLRQVKKYSTVFLILRDVMEESEQAEVLLTNPPTLEKAIKEQANKRYKSVQGKIGRAVVRAVIYIFITKMLLALAIEYPYELFVVHSFLPVPLLVNILFHPTLLFLIAVSVRIPTKKNTERIVATLKGMLYEYQKRNVPLILRRPRHGVLTTVFRVIYALTFIITFGLIVMALRRIGFNPVSTIIFLLFLSIISFFGIRIRQQTRELVVLNASENILTAIIDFFTVPVLQVGRWISIKAPKINVFIFILDFIIETPFKTLMEVTEQWFAYLREKKEEVL